MIKVKLYATLAEKSRLRKKDFKLPASDPLSVRDIVKSELPQGWDEYVMAIVNGLHVDLDQSVRDGDEVELMLAVQGGR
ncbi:MAG: MoaD/ThiS family protein [Dehalococcoidia bacterium]|nr:MoaD/ThiS family protein [Dehalococcoidia bacterium]